MQFVLDESIKLVPVNVKFWAVTVVAVEFISLGLCSASMYWKLQLFPGHVFVTISFVVIATVWMELTVYFLLIGGVLHFIYVVEID